MNPFNIAAPFVPCYVFAVDYDENWWNFSMAQKLIDLTGRRFGSLVANDYNPKLRMWNCICDCGREDCKGIFKASSSNLRLGHIKRCGGRRIHHNLSHGPEFKAWDAAIQRCYNPNCKEYKNYGSRGITVCDEWRNSFFAFYQHIGPRPEGLTLDRIDNNGNYEPGNVRWATFKVQRANQRQPSRRKVKCMCGKCPMCYRREYYYQKRRGIEYRRPRMSSSEFKGVSWHKVSNKWLARVTILGKRQSLGYFDSEQAAAYAIKSLGAE